MNNLPDIIDVIVKDNTLIFSDQLINSLQASAGDRISIVYALKNDNLVPLIKIDPNEGNKLSKENSISFRGQQRKRLLEFGSAFYISEKLDDGSIELFSNGIPIFTTIEKASQTYITKQIIQDTNYNITKLTNYEF